MVEPVSVRSSDLLAFAGLDPVAIRSLSIEQHLAEKVHAYTRGYGPERTAASSRVKDLVDLALVASTLPVNAAELRTALVAIFERRAIHQLPTELPRPPADWPRPWRQLVRDMPVPDDLGEGFELAQELLDPVLGWEGAETSWDPERRDWA